MGVLERGLTPGRQLACALGLGGLAARKILTLTRYVEDT